MACHNQEVAGDHWNGTSWKQVRSPSPGAGDVLAAVAAISGADAWAVGSTGAGVGKILIARWNGTTWK